MCGNKGVLERVLRVSLGPLREAGGAELAPRWLRVTMNNGPCVGSGLWAWGDRGASGSPRHRPCSLGSCWRLGNSYRNGTKVPGAQNALVAMEAGGCLGFVTVTQVRGGGTGCSGPDDAPCSLGHSWEPHGRWETSGHAAEAVGRDGLLGSAGPCGAPRRDTRLTGRPTAACPCRRWARWTRSG